MLTLPALADPSTGVDARQWHFDLNAGLIFNSPSSLTNLQKVYQGDGELSYGVGKRLAIYGDVGAASVTRSPYQYVGSANYNTFVWGAGTKYTIGSNAAVGVNFTSGPQLDLVLPNMSKTNTEVQAYGTFRVF